MATYLQRGGDGNRRRAIVAVQVGVCLVVLIGFAAMTVDVGTLYNARGDLQRTADAAALAGASAFTTDEMMSIRTETAGEGTLSYVTGLAASRVREFAAKNPTFLGDEATRIATEDIKAGFLKLNDKTANVHENPQPWDFNAVYVMVRREAEGENGPVPLFFAPIFGKMWAESTASAVAVFDDRVTGYNPDSPGTANLLPFAIHEDKYEEQRLNGLDQFGYDESARTLYDGPDSTPEVKLYPWPLSGDGSDGSGNFGFLNVGTENQGADAEANQILNGITGAEIEAEIGTSEPTFYSETGTPIDYEITGSPGLTASHEAAIEQLLGQVVGFFLYSTYVNPGSGNIYTVTNIRFGRVMHVDLKGNSHNPDYGFFIQPVAYSGGGVQIDPDAPSSHGQVGRLVLAR